MFDPCYLSRIKEIVKNQLPEVCSVRKALKLAWSASGRRQEHFNKYYSSALIEKQRLSCRRQDLLSTSTTRERMSSLKGPEKWDQAHKQKHTEFLQPPGWYHLEWCFHSREFVTCILAREMQKATCALLPEKWSHFTFMRRNRGCDVSLFRQISSWM